MKRWGKVCALCLLFSIIATILISCGPKIDATGSTIITDPTIDEGAEQSLQNDSENDEEDPDFAEPIINHANQDPTPNEETNHEDLTLSEEPPAHEHDYGKWQLTKSPSCTEPGEETRVCSCGDSETRIINTIAHDYQCETIAATCCENGQRVYTCRECGYSYSEIISLSEELHRYIQQEIVNPTCTDDGYTLFKCSICHKQEHRFIVPALGHVLIEYVQQPTCCSDGIITRKCQCGYYETETILASPEYHQYVSQTIEPTCTDDGYTCQVCIHCGEKTTEHTNIVDKLGHDYHCTQSTPATCCQDGYEIYTCQRCGHSYEKIISQSAQYHQFHTMVIAPTCTEAGYTLHECTLCQHTYRTDTVSELGHTYQCTTIEPTCNQSGSNTYLCQVCGHSYTEELIKLEHEVDDTGHCKHCHELLITKSPIENLLNTYWYLKTENNWTIHKDSWALCFETYKSTKKPNKFEGGYYAYKGTLNNGKFTTTGEKSNKMYHGTYTITADTTNNQTQYTIQLCDILCEENGTEHNFTLTYEVKHDEINHTIYYTLNGDLFNKYNNCTLIFAEEGV